MRPMWHKNGARQAGASRPYKPHDRITVRTCDFRSRIAIFGPEILERCPKERWLSSLFLRLDTLWFQLLEAGGF